MISLNTIIPIEYIKQNKKLQDIGSVKYYKVPNHRCRNDKGIEIIEKFFKSKWYEFYPVLTIADIIDNAEMLFGNREIKYGFDVNDFKEAYKFKGDALLTMCQERKTIEEISSYILENIK